MSAKTITSENSLNTVSPSEMSIMLKALYKKRAPKPIILGTPGCGKTSICYQIAEQLGIPHFTFQATLYDPTEIKGLPIYDHQKGEARFLPFSDMPSMDEGLLIIDDLPHAPTQTQNAFMRLILEGVAGAWNIGGLFPIATGNKAVHRAGAKDLQTAMANRFCFLELNVSYDDWRGWAINHNVHPSIVAFLGTPYGKEWLDNFDATVQINPTPRSWESASHVMHALEHTSASLMRSGMFGCVGYEATSKFMGWLKYYEKMPDLHKILAGGKGSNIYPDDMNVMYATISGLVSLVKEFSNSKKTGVIQRMIDYAVGMPDNYVELGTLLSRDLMCIGGEDAFRNANLDEWMKIYPSLLTW